MRILGIESSCDETAAAIVEDGERLLSNVVNSQIDIHAEYGGVIPEIAARSHLEVINPVIKKALSDADCTWDDIDAIAVTYAPGLIGSLLIGTLAARTLAIIHNKPLYKIHHVEAHVYANFITKQGSRHIIDKSKTVEPTSAVVFEEAVTGAPSPVSRTPRAGKATRKEYSEKMIAEVGDIFNAVAKESDEKASQRAEAVVNSSDLALSLPHHQPTFPLLALIVSGGHSQLVLFQNHGDYQLIGQTQDDAVGEAFDKVAKILGLPYPGGPAIAKAAELGDPHAFHLPIAKLAGEYDFSFSGLKTAVLRAVQREVGKDFTFPSHELPALVNDELRHNMAASFQYTAVKTLVDKTKKAYDNFQPASVVIAGGVAANQELRRQLRQALPINIEYAPIQLCTDNAAMIAALGYFRAQIDQPADPYDLEVQPSLSMTAI
ncbi:MAG: tRNA (adenosine(37)-N6)-threonylcarbamoyltransferase complex transferase subunit TsaD [Candidatus Nanosynbacter sp.]